MQVTKAGIERIKASNELSAVVAERGIEVKRKGRHLVASCPFHEEKEASFTITPGKGLYHCFGCGAAGDVIGFVTKHDKVSFGVALEVLARRSNLDLTKLMEEPRRAVHVNVSRPLGGTPLEALTPPPEVEAKVSATAAPTASNGKAAAGTAPPAAILCRVVEHYHKTFTEREDAQTYLKKRGLSDVDLWRTFKLGYADGSLQKLIPKTGELRQQLLSMGVLTSEGRELLGGCIVFPIPDPLSGEWTTLYGRGMRTTRHCYLPGPLRGVLNYQAARSASEVVLTESVIDALSFLEAGITSAIPLYGTNGFTGDHLDALLKSPTRRVVICLDNDEAGKKAALSLQSKLQKAGLQARIAALPAGVKDVNDLLVSRNGDAGEALRAVLSPPGVSAQRAEPASPLREKPAPEKAAPTSPAAAREEGLVVRVSERTYHAKAFNLQASDRLRVVLRAEQDGRFLVDAVDLYAARSRREYAKRAAVRLAAVSSRPLDPAVLEEELLQVLTQLEALKEEAQKEGKPEIPAMSEGERQDALAFLKRPDLLDQVARDIDALGFVGEETVKRLLYLVAVSRKLPEQLSAIVLSQSGAGKSGATEVIERLTPPEDVVLFTRLTPQSLYYTEPGFLDRKLVIVEERYGSMEADYSIRVLQSRGKLIAAAPVKDPQTGNMRTKVFTVEARCAFIEATTASAVNHENATRCFELSMDESSEQTKRIHERQRLMRTERGLALRAEAEVITRRHWNAQRLLTPLPVVIPFAHLLTFPDAWMRTRRDHARFLNLIEVSAFLHQHQRRRSSSTPSPHRGEGRGEGVPLAFPTPAILADVADYAVAYRLAGQVLQDTLSDVRKPLREAFERIRELSLKGKDGTVSRREIREALGLPDSTVRGWLAQLVELEYLEAEASKGGAGKATRYRLSERGPKADAVVGLLTPEELRSRC